MKSKWADDERDVEDAARRKREKEEKKRAKAEKQRRQDEEQARTKQSMTLQGTIQDEDSRPNKRRRLSQDGQDNDSANTTPLLRFEAPGWSPSQTVAEFETLNPIEEGTYGFVSRARSRATGEIVALKKMKLDQPSYGFPVTALREIQTLQLARHRNIVELKEVVVGDSSNKLAADDVYLVMEFAAHDLKSLLEDMSEPFLSSEVKTLMLQLTSALAFLHDNWILHRDLKTSNILLNSEGCLKLADFGMARLTSSPAPPNLTSLVVTLWYRGPELLLGATTYGFAVDMWSLGCVFGELLTREPLLQGRNEVDQLSKIFGLVGLPSDSNWPGFRRLPNAKTLKIPARPPSNSARGSLRETFSFLSPAAFELLRDLITLDPEARPTAADVSDHRYFQEPPRPKAEELMPTFPSKAGLEKRRARRTPNAPVRGEGLAKVVDFSGLVIGKDTEAKGAEFQLKMG
ncbi:hypothetical protein ANO11243_060120 [Dothideomycetidae sp. 11243]|nr:hypothetical protein ANO11243_060120 [fungal sp. No.11243]